MISIQTKYTRKTTALIKLGSKKKPVILTGNYDWNKYIIDLWFKESHAFIDENEKVRCPFFIFDMKCDYRSILNLNDIFILMLSQLYVSNKEGFSEEDNRKMLMNTLFDLEMKFIVFKNIDSIIFNYEDSPSWEHRFTVSVIGFLKYLFYNGIKVILLTEIDDDFFKKNINTDFLFIHSENKILEEEHKKIKKEILRSVIKEYDNVIDYLLKDGFSVRNSNDFLLLLRTINDSIESIKTQSRSENINYMNNKRRQKLKSDEIL